MTLRIPVIDGKRPCCRCKIATPIDDLTPKFRCRACVSVVNAESFQRNKDRWAERRKEYGRTYRAAKRESISTRMAAWRRSAAGKAAAARYRVKNREVHLAKRKRFWARHRQRLLAEKRQAYAYKVAIPAALLALRERRAAGARRAIHGAASWYMRFLLKRTLGISDVQLLRLLTEPKREQLLLRRQLKELSHAIKQHTKSARKTAHRVQD